MRIQTRRTSQEQRDGTFFRSLMIIAIIGVDPQTGMPLLAAAGQD